MRWIVHIGAPKTGSTAIQRFLFEHRAQLPAHGVQYPDINLRGYGHHDLAFMLDGRYPEWATPQDRNLPQFCEELRSFLKAPRRTLRGRRTSIALRHDGRGAKRFDLLDGIAEFSEDRAAMFAQPR